MRVDESSIRKEKVADSKISGYKWTGSEHVITTIFQPGGRSKISARAETHHVIGPLFEAGCEFQWSENLAMFQSE